MVLGSVNWNFLNEIWGFYPFFLQNILRLQCHSFLLQGLKLLAR